MKTHEFDAYCDAQVCNSQDWAMDDALLLAEQERDFYEMEAEKVATWKRQGAREALESFRLFLLHCGASEYLPNGYIVGIDFAIRQAKDRIAELETVKGGVA